MNLMKKKDTLIINLIGGPGSGKSTTAAGLFYKLKQMGIDCEMALEFAKDNVWEESLMTLNDQIYDKSSRKPTYFSRGSMSKTTIYHIKR